MEQGKKATPRERKWLSGLARRYRLEGDPLESDAARRELLARVDIIPVSLTLAQAANESAWGQSRFAREGNNLFGIWTYDPDKGMVPKGRAKGAKHLVRRFDSLADAVRYYMHNLNSHPAYARLREIRRRLRQQGRTPDGLALAEGLQNYSAKGEEYIRLIRGLIERHNLAALDRTNPTG